MRKAVFGILLALLLAAPVGFVLANPSLPAADEHLEQAARDMGMTLEQAQELLAQARELHVRRHAHRQGISYEEAEERMEQRREQMERRKYKRNTVGHFDNCPRFSPPAE